MTYASSASSNVTGEASSVLVCSLAMLALEALLVLLLDKDDSFQVAHGMKQIAGQKRVQLCTGLWRVESLF